MVNEGDKRKRGRPRKPIEDKLSKVLTTDKQKAFLRNRIAGMTKRQAAIQAGYAPSTASIMAKRIEDKLSGNKYFQEEIDRQGFTVSRMVSKLDELLEAKHPFRPDQPDNRTQREALEMALKLRGAFPSKSKQKILIEENVEEDVEDQIPQDDDCPF